MNQQVQNGILQQTKKIYNAIATDFSNTRGRWWRGFGDFAQYVRPGDRVLDLGCGNGRMAEIFENSKIEYLGIDNSEELIKIARERFKDRPWIKFEVGDMLEIQNSKLKTQNFNLVLLIAALHHLPTKELREQVIKNIYNILKPGGRLVMINWNLWQVLGWKKNFRYWKYLFNWLEKISHGLWGVSDALVPWKSLSAEGKRFIHSFGKREVRRMLKQAGFEIEKLAFEIKGGEQRGILRGDNLLAVAKKK
jgi:ubiquinone/menaquinone biosynthesis C-methylase UbiE